jgi:uncharacterized C2H2 Zn-finger protein
MADRPFAALTQLAGQRQRLQLKERELLAAERRVLGQVDRLLSRVGYRLIAGSGPASKARAVARRKQELPKTLRCPKCDRRFSRQMHVARHMSAMHGGPKSQKNVKRQRPTTTKKSK